ncbi:hypothetical protein SAMN04490202_0814 [Pseudomonas reinekei]|uniref:Uncharacterized protein n=1 Tax=Pseudomonas reinekei TaxID=395598 RepID=A0A1H0JCZ9_PSERE|nr:hypothetical protein SAMN04490202_0814 [Pseudomonas reinekei]
MRCLVPDYRRLAAQHRYHKNLSGSRLNYVFIINSDQDHMRALHGLWEAICTTYKIYQIKRRMAANCCR